MATSGTIGSTRIGTAKLLDKAIRRCGLSPSSLTPEIVDSAKEDLYMFLTSLSVRGLNLWCIDKQLMGLELGKAKYLLPVGTQDLLNVFQSTHTFAVGTLTAAATYTQLALTTVETVVRYGIKFATPPASFQLQSSPNGTVWTTVQTVTDSFTAVTTYWFDVDPAVSSPYFRILSAGHVAESFVLCTNIRDLPVTPFSRDDYVAQPNKLQSGTTTLNYFFEKLMEPQITLWPVSDDTTRCIGMYRYRQIQDVGSLTDEVEIPLRWFESICWHLALRLAFEIPGVDAARRAELAQMANGQVLEIEKGESDGAPAFIAPRIGVYTR